MVGNYEAYHRLVKTLVKTMVEDYIDFHPLIINNMIQNKNFRLEILDEIDGTEQFILTNELFDMVSNHGREAFLKKLRTEAIANQNDNFVKRVLMQDFRRTHKINKVKFGRMLGLNDRYLRYEDLTLKKCQVSEKNVAKILGAKRGDGEW